MITRRMFIKALSAAAIVNPLNWWPVKAKAANVPCKAKRSIYIDRIYPAFRVLLDDGSIVRVWGVAPSDKDNHDPYFVNCNTLKVFKYARESRGLKCNPLVHLLYMYSSDEKYPPDVEQVKRLIPEPIWGYMRYVETGVENYPHWGLTKWCRVAPESRVFNNEPQPVWAMVDTYQAQNGELWGSNYCDALPVTRLSWGTATDRVKVEIPVNVDDIINMVKDLTSMKIL